MCSLTEKIFASLASLWNLSCPCMAGRVSPTTNGRNEHMEETPENALTAIPVTHMHDAYRRPTRTTVS